MTRDEERVGATPRLCGGLARRKLAPDGNRWIRDFEGGGRRRVDVRETVWPGR